MMKPIKVTAAVLALLAAPATAEMIPGVPATPLGYCQVPAATLAAATGLAACSGGIPAGTNMLLMQSETQNIRWRDDGAAPTATVGVLLVAGQPPVTYTGTPAKLQFIDATAGGILDVAFYRTP